MSSRRKNDTNDDEPLLLDESQPSEAKGGIGQYMTASNLLLLFYVVMAIVVGTANRVTFKLMQYSMVNYSYFVSQLTTFIYLPVNFLVIMFKLLFTNHITPEMTQFPKWKFWIMGAFDSLQGLLIVVGGNFVPGIMQNLLLQGVVPVTMLFSILMLRYDGDTITRKARAVLSRRNIKYREIYAGDEIVKAAKGSSVAKILVNGMDLGDLNELLRDEPTPDADVFKRFFSFIFPCCCGSKKSHKQDDDIGVSSGAALFGNIDPRGITLPKRFLLSELHGDVVLVSDSHSWKRHFKSFYSIAQYVGAIVIMGGLVFSVWPALSGAGGAGPLQWDLVFFSSTISIAISSVYKEIAFQEVSDMDVWYLNGWVALPQFLIGLLYAPLAAVMTDIPVDKIPVNLWNGLQCWLLGTNFIAPSNGYDCSNSLDCGVEGQKMCCDSCDGSLQYVSSLPAILAVALYMCFNIAYNVFLVLVIKHGSAALMYAASTVVLPLGSIAFTIHIFLGDHAQPFNLYTGVGLGIVIFGLMIYRFLDMFIKSKKD